MGENETWKKEKGLAIYSNLFLFEKFSGRK